MKKFNPEFLDLKNFWDNKRQPNFNNILKVLQRKKPDRPTLFEFFMNLSLYEKLAGEKYKPTAEEIPILKLIIHAFRNAGYDYTSVRGSNFSFPCGRENERNGKTISMNEGIVIFDRKSFEKYPWPDPDAFDYSRLERLAGELPYGMKLIVYGPGGVLEFVIALVGFDSLCYMLADDPDLVADIFNAVGSRLVRYYEICAAYDTVGALISNDDWGFNTQTLLSVENMRRFVIPWHKKIVETIHSTGKPVILHSCGQLERVMDDITNVIKYDAKHSYEDKILPVEEAYERWSDRIAIFGGIDMDFICRSTPEEVYMRSAAMLERTAGRGGYALGSGNSIPGYVPDENYLAMISAVNGI
ncbi:MAG: hypothetical protein FIA99_19620 [Ruminiclostridium sp.]|nr:hypothetical protein [Ruminiclostridium sp.]